MMQVQRLSPEMPIHEMKLFGKGISFQPLSGVCISREIDPSYGEIVQLNFGTQSSPRNAAFAFNSGIPRLLLSPDVASLEGLGRVEIGDVSNSLRIGSTNLGYSALWLPGYNIWTTKSDAHWPFELHDEHNSLIFVRGPWTGGDRVPKPHELVVPGQDIVAHNVTPETYWVEVAYENEGSRWNQTHTYGILGGETVALVTAQYRPEHSAKVREDAIKFAHSMAPTASA